MRVRLHPAAASELREATQWYSANAEPGVAADLVEAYDETIHTLKQRPHIGVPGPHETRTLAIRRFPSSIVYRITDNSLQVIAFAHWRRRPRYWSVRV